MRNAPSRTTTSYGATEYAGYLVTTDTPDVWLHADGKTSSGDALHYWESDVHQLVRQCRSTSHE